MALFYSIEDDLYQQAMRYWGWNDRSKLTFPANRASTQFPDCDWEMDLAYDGDVRTFAYARVPFSSLINDATARWATVTIDRALSGQEVIDAIRNQIGVPVDITDFDNPTLPYVAGGVQLMASATSRAFTGALKFTVRVLPTQLTELPANQYQYNFRNQLWYAHYDYEDTISGYTWTAKFNPGLLTYGLDYTSQADVLKTLVPHAPPFSASWQISASVSDALMYALKAVDGLPWQSSASHPEYDYNLYSAWVLYNGPVSGVDPTLTNTMGDVYIYPPARLRALAKAQGVPNPEYDNVLMVQLNSPYYGRAGYEFMLMIHYNNWS